MLLGISARAASSIGTPPPPESCAPRTCAKLKSSVMLQLMPWASSFLQASMPSQVEAILM